jgi:prolyl 4-hydroxylase
MTGAAAAQATGMTNRLFWIDGFLSPTQCERLVDELAYSFWRPSQVYVERGDSYGFVTSGKRISSTTSEDWFGPAVKRIIAGIDRRATRLLPELARKREPWQATCYKRGGRFGLHHDAGYFSGEPAGERTHTVLLYLDSPKQGGGTRFPRLGVTVACQTGRLVVWNNLRPDGTRDPEMVHAGMPVWQGRKTTLITWLRQNDFASNRGDDHDTEAAEGTGQQDYQEARRDARSRSKSRGDDRNPAQLRAQLR